jgi:hypothetical protein
MTETLTLEDGRIVALDKDGNVVTYCGRCDGKGRIAHFGHVFSGVCFECNGGGGRKVTTVQAEQKKAHNRVLAQARKDRKEAEKAAAQETARVKWLESLTDTQKAAVERAIADTGEGFFASLGSQASVRPLTDRQVSALVAAYDRQDAEKAVSVPAPEGRVVVVGTVVKVAYVSDNYSYTEKYTTKITVKSDAGYTVYVTAPGEIDLGDELKGKRVQFTATLTRSDRDESFAFGKRPSKPSLLD